MVGFIRIKNMLSPRSWITEIGQESKEKVRARESYTQSLLLTHQCNIPCTS